MPIEKHIAVYVRVSKHTQFLENQEPDLEQWLNAYAQDKPVVWYKEKTSGFVGEQKKFNRMVKSIEYGEVDTVLCWRLDRLGRKSDRLGQFFELLREKGTRLVSVREGIDLGTPIGRAMATMTIAIAQMESEIRSERTKAGLARSNKAQAKPANRRGGWTKGKPRDPERKQAIRELVEGGMSVRKACRIMHADINWVYELIHNENWNYQYKNNQLRRGGREYLEKLSNRQPSEKTAQNAKRKQNLTEPITAPESETQAAIRELRDLLRGTGGGDQDVGSES